jgi:hypothetical protein
LAGYSVQGNDARKTIRGNDEILETEEEGSMNKLLESRRGRPAMGEILTPKSNRWEAFTGALLHAVQANGCDSKTLHLAEAIMADMDNVDVLGSIEYFEEHGGYCDCEVLMNVDDWSAISKAGLRERVERTKPTKH